MSLAIFLFKSLTCMVAIISAIILYLVFIPQTFHRTDYASSIATSISNCNSTVNSQNESWPIVEIRTDLIHLFCKRPSPPSNIEIAADRLLAAWGLPSGAVLSPSMTAIARCRLARDQQGGSWYDGFGDACLCSGDEETGGGTNVVFAAVAIIVAVCGSIRAIVLQPSFAYESRFKFTRALFAGLLSMNFVAFSFILIDFPSIRFIRDNTFEIDGVQQFYYRSSDIDSIRNLFLIYAWITGAQLAAILMIVFQRWSVEKRVNAEKIKKAESTKKPSVV